jgi:hypothetical protein
MRRAVDLNHPVLVVFHEPSQGTLAGSIILVVELELVLKLRVMLLVGSSSPPVAATERIASAPSILSLHSRVQNQMVYVDTLQGTLRASVRTSAIALSNCFSAETACGKYVESIRRTAGAALTPIELTSR